MLKERLVIKLNKENKAFVKNAKENQMSTFQFDHSLVWCLIYENLNFQSKDLFTSSLLTFRKANKDIISDSYFVCLKGLGVLGTVHSLPEIPRRPLVVPYFFRNRDIEMIKVQGRKNGLEFEDIEFTSSCVVTLLDQNGQLWKNNYIDGSGMNLYRIS